MSGAPWSFMRLALLATVSSFVIAGAVFACSNAPPQAEEDADSGTTLPPKNDTPAPAATNNETNGDNNPTDSTGSDASTEGGITDAGAGNVGSTDGDGGSRCLATSIRESEPNNDVAGATKLPATTHTFCGRLTANDVDFFTFTMPDSVANFGFNIENFTGSQLKIEPSADGEPFNFFGNYPFKAGKPYVIKISAKGTAEYRLKVQIDQ